MADNDAMRDNGLTESLHRDRQRSKRSIHAVAHSFPSSSLHHDWGSKPRLPKRRSEGRVEIGGRVSSANDDREFALRLADASTLFDQLHCILRDPFLGALFAEIRRAVEEHVMSQSER
jgi:hypothetical protein